MNKIIAGVSFGILMFYLMATIDLWKTTPMKDVFTLLIAFVFVIGSVTIGMNILAWFEENDTTGATDAN